MYTAGVQAIAEVLVVARRWDLTSAIASVDKQSILSVIGMERNTRARMLHNQVEAESILGEIQWNKSILIDPRLCRIMSGWRVVFATDIGS